MSPSEDSMQQRRQRMGAGMGAEAGTEMDSEQPDLHTLDPEEQRARMAVSEPAAVMGQPPSEGGASEEEVAQREEAAKRGEGP